ncbi:unnamed protein product [Urochloa humidicola]
MADRSTRPRRRQRCMGSIDAPTMEAATAQPLRVLPLTGGRGQARRSVCVNAPCGGSSLASESVGGPGRGARGCLSACGAVQWRGGVAGQGACLRSCPRARDAARRAVRADGGGSASQEAQRRARSMPHRASHSNAPSHFDCSAARRRRVEMHDAVARTWRRASCVRTGGRPQSELGSGGAVTAGSRRQISRSCRFQDL